MVDAADYSPPTESLWQRILRWIHVSRSRESRKAHLMNQVVPRRKYYTFYVGMTALTIARLLLNFAGFFLVATALDNFAPSSTDYSSTANLPYEYTVQTFRVLKHSKLAHDGGWCLVASLGLHVVMYASHKTHLVRTISDGDEFPTPIYWLAHIGVLNWLFDVPGFRVPTVYWVHIIIILVNLTAGLVFFCVYYFRRPMVLAWGCYPPESTIFDHRYGKHLPVTPTFGGVA